MLGKRGLLFLVFVALAFSAATANATIVTIGLTAEITYSEWDIFKVGDIITGSYTYNTDTPDSNPSNTVADYVYRTSPYGINLSVNGFSIQSHPENPVFLVEIINDHIGIDGYLIRSYNNLPLSNGIPVWHISWQLQDYSQNALSSTHLLETPPVLEEWPDDWGLSVTFGYKGGFGIRAEVTTVQFIPEPGSVLLFALVSLSFLKRPKS